MFIGKVVGSLWATQKEAGMENLKLLVIQPMDWKGNLEGKSVVAADRIGAGVEELVVVTRGTSANILFDKKTTPIDAIIVGIVDSLEIKPC